MGKASFFGNMVLAKLNTLGDALTTALVSFDPESASEAEIMSMEQHVQELSAKVAHVTVQAQNDARRVTTLQAQFDRCLKAADVLNTRLEVAKSNGSADAATLESKLGQVLTEAEKYKKDLEVAQSDAKYSSDEVAEWTQVHQQATTAWTQARDRLQRSQRDMQRAQEERRREEERTAQAKRDAGLKQGLGSTSIATTAMEKAAREAHEAAMAAKLTREAIQTSSSGGAEDIIAQTLAEEKPAATSVADRLAALRK